MPAAGGAAAALADPRTVRIGGVAIRVADDQPTFWDRVERGAWEPATLACLARLLGPGVVLLDLGAWVGPVALYGAALGARVVAAEADPAALDQLRRNLAVNPDLAVRITVVPKAVAPGAGTVRMGARRKPGDSMSSVLLADQAGWDVPAVTPSDLAALLRPGERLVCKVDLEGAEYALLPAMGALLRRPSTSTLVSFHPAILRETASDPDGSMDRAARAALAGLRASPVGAVDPAPAWTDPDALDRCETWLFEPA